jgi:DNA-binding NtrC family response regulator
MLLAVGAEVDAATVELALPQAGAPPLSPAGFAGDRAGPSAAGPLSQRTAEFERETILAELRRHQHHITNTARALGLERSHLYKKCQQLGIDLRAARGGAGS